MGVEIRFDDGTWSYALGPSLGRAGQELPVREARRVLERWLTREPWRSQLRGYAGLEIRAEARADDVLIERVCALLQARGVGLWRVERMEQWDAAGVVEAEEAEAEPLVVSAREATSIPPAPISSEEAEELAIHTVQFRAVDKDTGEPVVAMPYRIVLGDGTRIEGKTNDQGHTLRIGTTEPEDVELFWLASVSEDTHYQEDDPEGC